MLKTASSSLRWSFCFLSVFENSIKMFVLSLYIIIGLSLTSSVMSFCPAYEELASSSANVSDMIGEWYVVASTKNDCKCKVLNTDVTSNSTEYMTFDMTYDCVLSNFKVKSNENRRGVAFPSTGGLFLGGSSLPFGAVGTLGRGIVFDSREVANQTYIFVTTDCDQETSTFRVLAKDSSKLPGKKNLQDVIDSVDSVKYLNTTNLILRTSDVWHQCNSSLPQGECGKYYGTCPEEDECCKGAGMGKGYFCDTCD